MDAADAETLLEEALLLDDERAVEYLVREEDAGIVQQRREYLSRQAPTRNKQLVRNLQGLYEGRCQICLWNPKSVYGVSLCQGHHIHWLSRGGEDDKGNMVLICPNHHAAVHRCDAQLDCSDMSFDFGNHEEPLQLILHSLG